MTANMRVAKRDMKTLQADTLTLRQKLTEMEDRSRKCNIWLVGLADSAEGENAIQFLQQSLPVWISSLAVEKIKNPAGAPHLHLAGQTESPPDSHLPAAPVPGQGDNL